MVKLSLKRTLPTVEMEVKMKKPCSLHDELLNLGLRPVAKTGKLKFGESEITGVSSVKKGRFFTDVTFVDELPQNAGKREFAMRFNRFYTGCDGAVIFVELNEDHCLIIRQWRKRGLWTYEIPRGFADPSDNGRILAILERDIGHHPMQLLKVHEVIEWGDVDENTGTSNISPMIAFVRAEADVKKLTDCYGKNAQIKLEAWSYDRVWSEIGKKIRDLHSIAAVSLAKKYHTA